MKVVIFTGPTLSAKEALSVLDPEGTIVRPPVAQGDLYRAALTGPHVIGIIDGLFEREPAVWHKEILWALSRGVHVVGAASMGALRAAELSAYGMVGVGAIFEALASGAIEDDDEVAVAHGDAESGYRAMSEALVNIRFTLAAATAEGVIDADASHALLEIARGFYYPDRSWPALFAAARARHIPLPIVDALASFVAHKRIDQKRRDALAMLSNVRSLVVDTPEPRRVAFTFEHTDAWDQVMRRAAPDGATDVHSAGGSAVSAERLAEEARLDANSITATFRGALLRAVAEAETRRRGKTGDAGLPGSADFEEQVGSGRDRERFVAENDLDGRGFEALVESETRLAWLEIMHEPDVLRHLPDELRAAGRYPALASRARDKQRLLDARGLADPTLADLASLAPFPDVPAVTDILDVPDGESPPRRTAPTDEASLLRWYFEERLGRPLPASTASRLRAVALTDEETLRREALREYLYLWYREHGEP